MALLLHGYFGTIQRTVRPKGINSIQKRVNLGFAMNRRRRKAQSFSALWNGWEIDRLHVDAKIVEQHVRELFGMDRVPYHERNNVTAVIDYGQSEPTQTCLQNASCFLMLFSKYLI